MEVEIQLNAFHLSSLHGLWGVQPSKTGEKKAKTGEKKAKTGEKKAKLNTT